MSALVLAVLVVMWAVVLVPMFLRRSERSHELTGPARFAGAMRVLSRRRAATAEIPAGERRAATISAALSSAPDRPVRSGAPEPVLARRRSSRVAARKRGLAVMLGVLLVSLLLAALVGGLAWLSQAAVDLLVLAGFAQLRALAIADRMTVRMPRSAPRPMVVAAAPQAVSPTPVVRREKTIVYDAVTEMPIVSRPRLREPVAASLARAAVAARLQPAAAPTMPADYYDAPAPPRRPEPVRRPLLDAVDSDPDTLADGIELLDGILGRASGE